MDQQTEDAIYAALCEAWSDEENEEEVKKLQQNVDIQVSRGGLQVRGGGAGGFGDNLLVFLLWKMSFRNQIIVV